MARKEFSPLRGGPRGSVTCTTVEGELDTVGTASRIKPAMMAARSSLETAMGNKTVEKKT
jgi:hypothetical protein